MLSSVRSSYDRTMAIVSDGMEKFISFADDVLSCHVNSAEVVDIEAY